jgi:hypothetical protein
MNAIETATVTKTTRRQVRKPTNPELDQKIKTAVHLSPRAFRQLGIASVMEGRTQSDLVERWILENCKRYVVSDRGHCDDRPESADVVNSAA